MIRQGLQDKIAVHILLIILLSLTAYSNTFNSSFHYDDEPVIIDNPIVKNFDYFIDPSKAEPLTGHFEYHTFKNRYIGYLTFALNYKLHGLDVTGYHIVNLLIHIISALLVYLLVLSSFRSHLLSKSSLREYSGYMALFTALLFVCHPIQTQAVTYIWQRVTSLAAAFCLLSLVSYVQWRIGTRNSGEDAARNSSRKSLFWYMGSVVSVLLAMKTKEIAFTFPLIIVLYEFTFFKGGLKRRILYLIPIVSTMLIIPLSRLSMDMPLGELAGALNEATRDLEAMPRAQYLFTEFRVLVTYLRIIFLPINQNLDYDYAISRSLLEPEVFLSFLLLSSIALTGIYLFYRSKSGSLHLRLISFGIFWFFITVSVESSFIPILGVIYEHRMYLPSIGVFIAVITSIFVLQERLKVKWKNSGKAIAGALTVAVFFLTAATYARNIVWKNEVSLWKDVVRKSPNRARGYNNLGNAYYSLGLNDKAVEEFRKAIELRPDYAKTYNNLGNLYQSQDLFDKAVEHYLLAVKFDPDFPEAHYNLGVIYQSQGLIDKAIEEYLKAIKIKPSHEQYNNLGNAYQTKGLTDEAVESYSKAIRLNPDFADPHNNLGLLYQQNFKDRIEKAVEHYRTAIKLNPDYPEAHYNLGSAYQSQGLIDRAIEHYKTAIKLRPEYPKAHTNLGIVYQYFSKGKVDQAIEHYIRAIELDPDSPGPHINLGNAYQSGKLFDKAIEHYLTAIKLAPDIPETHYNLGTAYKSKGLTEKAAKEYKTAVRLRPDWAIPHFELGQISFLKGDMEDARRELENTLQIDPEHVEAQQLLELMDN